jgi:hypothetical protein
VEIFYTRKNGVMREIAQVRAEIGALCSNSDQFLVGDSAPTLPAMPEGPDFPHFAVARLP